MGALASVPKPGPSLSLARTCAAASSAYEIAQCVAGGGVIRLLIILGRHLFEGGVKLWDYFAQTLQFLSGEFYVD
jgi:hypothetical protein